jgi:prophage regulatory protein
MRCGTDEPRARQANSVNFAADPGDRLIRLDEVKRRVGLGKTMIYRLIQESRFPAPYKLSPFASRWSEREIVAWIDAMKDGSEGKKRTL